MGEAIVGDGGWMELENEGGSASAQSEVPPTLQPWVSLCGTCPPYYNTI